MVGAGNVNIFAFNGTQSSVDTFEQTHVITRSIGIPMRYSGNPIETVASYAWLG